VILNTAGIKELEWENCCWAVQAGAFIGMSRATPEKFQFSIKVPESITHVKRLDVNKGVIMFFEDFLDKISLRTSNKLGAILFQLPLSLRSMILRIPNSFWTNCLPQMAMIRQWNLDILPGELQQ